jgi:hypothetical protein
MADDMSLAGGATSGIEKVVASGTDPSRVLLYVHGTFAPDASWTHADSALTQTILKRDLGTHVYRFIWSGKNKMHDRITASENLALYIRKLKASYPESLVYVIAHSHGGNVVFHALRSPDVEACLSGVICMSTPFLHMHPLKHDTVPDVTTTLITLPIIMLMCTAGWALHSINLLNTLMFFVCLPFVRLTCSRSSQLWQQASFKLVDAFTAPKITLPVLILRSIGDEASMALASAAFGSWLVGRSSRLIGGPATFLTSAAGLLVLTPFMFPWFITLLLLPLLPVAATLWAAGMITAYLAAVLSLPLFVFIGLFYRAFTPWLAFYAHMVALSAETTPVGVWQQVLLPSSVRTTYRATWSPGEWHASNPPHSDLAHSGIYNHPQGIQLICDWIQDSTCITDRCKYVWDDDAPHSWPVLW